jgi:DHA1 family bicyclomycin/chloramphenicol resistance-like MFS transporter
MIRDRASGREMARVMSLVMMVFILVPAIAPAIGQIILLFAEWRMIFVALVVLASITLCWFYLRQAETLAKQNQRPFSLSAIWQAIIEICTTRAAVVYTIAGGMIFGAFIGFLNSSQQVLQELYGLGAKFPFYFAALALTIGVSSFVNSRLVNALGMRLLSKLALWSITLVGLAFFVLCLTGQPSLILLMTYLLLTFFAIGLLFGNLNSLAMEPLGHIAGLASSAIGCVTTFMALSLGYLIGSLYNHTLLPMVGGFGLLAAGSLVLIYMSGER